MRRDLRLNKTGVSYALVSLAMSIGVLNVSSAGAVEWEPVAAEKNDENSSQLKSHTPQQKKQSALKWKLVTSNERQSSTESSLRASMSGSTTAVETTPALMWQAVDPTEVIDTDEISSEDSEESNQIAVVPTVQPVTGGLFQIKRADQWLPSVTQRIPNGFGGSFGDFQTGLWLADCGVSGGYVCGDGTRDWVTEFHDTSENDWISQVSLGDPNIWLGLDLGLTISSLADTRPNTSSEGTPFGSGQGLHLALSRNITPDIGIKVGAFNLVELDKVQYDAGKSAYGVVSARFDLGGEVDENTNDLYITAGFANGIYRPLNAILEDQARECNSMRKRQGNHLSPYLLESGGSGFYCNMWGLDYGTLWPVGSIAYMLNPKFSLFGEWWGRNLTLGFSIKPFEDINWIVTPGITNLIHNSDWDSDLPGHTERLRLQLTTSFGF